mgnify:FL=1|jgi:hypothetical protein|nr:MAG TPA: hypothetical protein [Caudoviricetes sp.]
MKKRIILTLSKRFPIFHSKKGKPTYFKEKLNNTVCNTRYTISDIDNTEVKERKIHTIRTNFARWKHNIGKIESGGFYLSIRQWSARAYNSPQEEIFQLHDSGIGCQRITMSYNPETKEVKAIIDGKYTADVEQIAENDGMQTSEFLEWFFGKNPTEKKLFSGVIIHFTPFRYGSDTNKSVEDSIIYNNK